MGDHRGRPGAVNLMGPFVGVDLDLRPIVDKAVVVLARTWNLSNQAKRGLAVRAGAMCFAPVSSAQLNLVCHFGNDERSK